MKKVRLEIPLILALLIGLPLQSFAPVIPVIPRITNIVIAGGVTTITFTAPSSSGFTPQLISSSIAFPRSVYTPVPGAVNVNIATNTFQVVVTNTAPVQFYAIRLN